MARTQWCQPCGFEWLGDREDCPVCNLERRTKALQGMLERYVELVNCGDCGNWDPEKETVVISAREALSDGS